MGAEADAAGSRDLAPLLTAPGDEGSQSREFSAAREAPSFSTAWEKRSSTCPSHLDWSLTHEAGQAGIRVQRTCLTSEEVSDTGSSTQ